MWYDGKNSQEWGLYMDAVNEGSNLKQVKKQNLCLLLRHVARGTAATRADLARATGLSKMTVSNLVAELTRDGLLEETGCFTVTAPGRPPMELRLAADAPLLCGMLIKRGLCQVVLADLAGVIVEKETYPLDAARLTAEILVETLLGGFRAVTDRASARVAAVGIASIGPVDTVTGTILDPADFSGIRDLPIVERVREATGLPAFLLNDANAGALAETLYGWGRELKSFVYLHIMNGIGAGMTLEGTVHNGDYGQSGEIGHTSINFDGPLCACGNRGCLDLYANITTMRRVARELSARFTQSPLGLLPSPEWEDFMEGARRQDPLALAVLDDFCAYLCHALVNLLNTLDVSTVIIGYPGPRDCRVVEELLARRLEHFIRYRKIRLLHSHFWGDAPLVGAAAVAADRIFRCELEL